MTLPVPFLLLTVLAAPAPAGVPKGGARHVYPKLLPYPQEVQVHDGTLPLGPPRVITARAPSATERVAKDTLRRSLPSEGRPVPIRLGSVEEGYDADWLSPPDREFLSTADGRKPEASVLTITPDAITVVGQSRRGMLYGVQTVNQLAREASGSLPCVTIRDWPDMDWRCLSPTLTWYSGWNRLEGYDLCNWTLDEWRWLVDWSLLHKMNAWAVCMYGYWPFDLPGYEEATLQVDSFFFDPVTGEKTPYRFIHRNIKREFLPELIRYANERGIGVYAYIGKNSFNGGYILRHPETNAGGAAEAIPFAPGVHEYWDAFIGKILESGFNGFVFEDPEAYHVPNQNEECYRTFWEPWAETYGFHSRAETDQNKPPLGVHVEYYGWLFREFEAAIRRHSERLGRSADIYLISHMLLSRIMGESKTPEELRRWLALVDEKQGRRVRFIVNEADEARYTELLGGNRVASLGGRGGSCLCAWRRMTGVNNNTTPGPMGASVDWERDCQRRIHAAGGFGAMGYVFEWRSNEIYGYIASQYLWRNAGVPGISNDNQMGFLDYAYRRHYGEGVGDLVARALDLSPCVNDAMVLEDVHGAQYPETGRALHRDYQLLAAQADEALALAQHAYRLWTGNSPDLYRPAYDEDGFQWDGYDLRADRLFKEESLRLLCVELRRAQVLCEAALAHRLAARRAAEGATIGAVLGLLDRAVALAEENQRLYQVNFDDDYDWNDGLCVRLAERFRELRVPFTMAGSAVRPDKEWRFGAGSDPQGWKTTNDLAPPIVRNGALVLKATGPDPFVLHAAPIGLDGTDRQLVRIDMSSDRDGWAELYWWTSTEAGPGAHLSRFQVAASDEVASHFVQPHWGGTVAGLRLDTPDGSTVRVDAIRIETPPDDASAGTRARPVPRSLRRTLGKPLFIPWEKLSDITPESPTAARPGLYLSVHLGLNALRDYYCHGVVFTVEAHSEGGWRRLFRRAVGKNATDWEHWDIPVPADFVRSGRLRVRLATDAYSRAQQRDALSWEWPLWGQPELVRVADGGRREVLYRFADRVGDARGFVVSDRDGLERQFDGGNTDSTGATFRLLEPSALQRLRDGEGRSWQWVEGFAGASTARAPHSGGYRNYLGVVPSWWAYAYESGEVAWETAPVPARGETAVVFIGGTNYEAGRAELFLGGVGLLGFDTGRSADASWEGNGAELRYLHGGDTRDERIPYGLSGVFVLRLRPDLVTPGEPLRLAVRMLPDPANSAWFMAHGYASALRAAGRVVTPEPARPAILASTPHLGGAYGVAGAEYDIDVWPGAEGQQHTAHPE